MVGYGENEATPASRYPLLVRCFIFPRSSSSHVHITQPVLVLLEVRTAVLSFEGEDAIPCSGTGVGGYSFKYS